MNASKAHVLPHRWMRSIAAARSALLHRTVAVLLMLAVVATAGGCDREIGGWSQLADPPFKTREGAFAAALGDGRLLVWGGVREADGRCTGTAPVDGLGDGGIYDPTTNTWAYVPESPLRPFVPGPATGLEVQLADDRLAVVELYEDGTVHAAVYDVAAQRWDEAPRSEITPWEAVGWDGQTLTMLDRSARTVRWTPGSPVWTTAAQFPLAPRVISGTAFDGRHLAVWGGLDSAGHFLDDGAIYDVQTDAWQVMSAGPLTARAHAGVMWSKGALLVGGGLDRLDNPEFLRDLASYDPTHDTWDSLASSPEGGPVANRPNFAEGNEPLLITQTIVTEAVVKPQWFFGDAGWELAPQPDVHSMGEQVIAASNVPFNPGSGNLAVAVRRPDGVWETGRSATFKNRGFAAIATAGGRLYVTTGCEQTGQGFDMRLAEGAWVFDPAQSG